MCIIKDLKIFGPFDINAFSLLLFFGYVNPARRSGRYLTFISVPPMGTGFRAPENTDYPMILQLSGRYNGVAGQKNQKNTVSISGCRNTRYTMPEKGGYLYIEWAEGKRRIEVGNRAGSPDPDP